MNLPDLVSWLRLRYHANMLDVNNVLNQLGLRSDEKAEEAGKYHFGEEAVKKLFEEKNK